MTVEQAIKKLENMPKDSHIAISLWLPNDVKGIAKEFNATLNDEEVGVILKEVEDNMDAEYGINWESIRCAVGNLIDDKKE